MIATQVLVKVLGREAEVDLSEFDLADGKAAIAAIADAAPTVESLTRGRKRAV